MVCLLNDEYNAVLTEGVRVLAFWVIMTCIMVTKQEYEDFVQTVKVNCTLF